MTGCLSAGVYIGWSTAKLATSEYFMRIVLAYVGLMILGAWIASMYSMMGGGFLMSFEMFSTRSFLFPFTFTNSVSGLFIRPAGLFNEPGALAMYIVLLVVLLEVSKAYSRATPVLLLTGLVTGSLALFIVTLTYYLFSKNKRSTITSIVMLMFFFRYFAFKRFHKFTLRTTYSKKIGVSGW